MHSLRSLSRDDARVGFTLVELSIVLVILGLLVGGVLAGQNLIRAAELRSVLSEFYGYQTAAQTFKEKYLALPGDLSNAEDFWGSMSTGTCPNATGGTGTETCNGDGDNLVERSNPTASQFSEQHGFFQHLANAGLLEGTFTGRNNSLTSNGSTIGENVPESDLPSGGWTASYTAPQSGHDGYFDGMYGNVMTLGTDSGSSRIFDPVVSPEEMWGIDTKADDGAPALGNIRVRWRVRTPGNCTTAADGTLHTGAVAESTQTGALYNLSETEITCTLVFRNAF